MMTARSILNNNGINRKNFITCATLLCTLIMSASIVHAGWFSANGKTRLSSETTALFEAGEVNPNLSYYIAGVDDASPDAIIGIRKEIELENIKSWKKIDLTPDDLEEMVKNMKAVEPDLYFGPKGLDIYDNQGNHIGIWYSIERWAVIKIRGNNKVVIYKPMVNRNPAAGDGGG